MRSMWRGAISFGLVMIPVRLYAATEQRDVAFRQVHQADGGRIRYRRVCSVCGQEVEYADIAKGYELPDGEMVVLTDEDFAELPLPTAHSIEVVNFAPADQVDPVLCGRAYYAEPEPAGLRAYALLHDALEQSDVVGIARVALRQRESLASVQARDGLMLLTTLLWPDEVREPDFGFLDQKTEVRPQELQMATSLISSMTSDFDPSQYHDHYREAVEELVAAKAEGHEVYRPAPREGEEAVASLADALRASLEASKAASPDGARRAAGEDSGRGRRRAADGASDRKRRRVAAGGEDEDSRRAEADGEDGGRRRAAAASAGGGSEAAAESGDGASGRGRGGGKGRKAQEAGEADHADDSAARPTKRRKAS